jgi:hypothetical protein
MPIMLKPAKNLPKNLMDEPMVLINPTGASIDDDPIITFASKIEKVSTRTEIEEIIKTLNDEREFDFFKLGGAIAVAQALFDKSKSEFKGYKNFREYVKKALGIGYSNAMRAAEIYKKLLQLEIPWSAFENIGWTKVLALLDVVGKDNVKQWVAKAKGMNVLSLNALVEAEKQKGKPETVQGPKAITTKTFKLHADQKQLVADGLKKAQDETGSDVEAVNLEAVFQNYLGGGLAFADEDQAMTYAAKHANDPQVFVEKQVARLKQLFPQLDITVEITLKKPAAAA